MLPLVTLVVAATGLLAATPAHARGRELEEIVIAPATASLIPGRTQAFTATGLYSDDTSEDLTAQVVWRSRDTRVATIDPAGLATAVASGRTEIGASLPGTRVSARHTGRLAVVELDKLAVEPVSAAVRVGGMVALEAIGTYDDGTSGIDLTQDVEWSSQKRSVVAIDRDEEGRVVAVGVARGQTNVVARDPETNVKSSSSTGRISVVGSLLNVDVSPDERLLRVGERARFKALGTFENGVAIDISADVDWSTSDAGIATVDNEGRATAVALGTTRVIATDRATGISSTRSAADGQVRVVGPMTSLRVKPASLSIELGGKGSLKASALFAGVTRSVNVTTKVEWRSSDPAAVAVSRLGVASCVSTGTATVSARDLLSGLTSTATGGDAVVRCGVPVVGVRVAPESLKLRAGESKKIKAYLVYSDDSREEITKRVVWASSNLLVVTVDREEPNIGRVNGQTPGLAVVTAHDPVTGLTSTAPGGASLAVTVP